MLNSKSTRALDFVQTWPVCAALLLGCLAATGASYGADETEFEIRSPIEVVLEDSGGNLIATAAYEGRFVAENHTKSELRIESANGTSGYFQFDWDSGKLKGSYRFIEPVSGWSVEYSSAAVILGEEGGIRSVNHWQELYREHRIFEEARLILPDGPELVWSQGPDLPATPASDETSELLRQISDLHPSEIGPVPPHVTTVALQARELLKKRESTDLYGFTRPTFGERFLDLLLALEERSRAYSTIDGAEED